MELTVDEALSRAIQAQKAGRLTEADQLYTAILNVKPYHPDANHNIGLLAIGVGKTTDALPYLRRALETRPANQQFWASYVSALIKANKPRDAQYALELASCYISPNIKLDQLAENLGALVKSLDFTRPIRNYYSSRLSEIISTAASGWQFTVNYDYPFLIRDDAETMFGTGQALQRPRDPKADSEVRYSRDHLRNRASAMIRQLELAPTYEEKYRILQSLIESEDPCLVIDDSRANQESIAPAKNPYHSNTAFNVLIVGGGVTGLYLACTLKRALSTIAQILVIDNRCHEPGVRRIFDRDWLTDVEKSGLAKAVPGNISELMQCFGTGNKIGIPINLLETILMLSCRDQGVSFLFSSSDEWHEVIGESVDVYFDATGGRLREDEITGSAERTLRIEMPPVADNYEYAGLTKHNRTTASIPAGDLFTLAPSGRFHFPAYQNTDVQISMIKITGISARSVTAVLAFVRENNIDNMFYVWKGKLQSNINEALVFVSLDVDSERKLKEALGDVCPLRQFYTDYRELLGSLDERIELFFKLLLAEPYSEFLSIGPPFRYRPHINMLEKFEYYRGKPIFPIGDALYSGHPKVGNGLGYHLRFINGLVEHLQSDSFFAHTKLDLHRGYKDAESE